VSRLARLPPLGSPDLVAVALRVLGGILGLRSALAVHDLTTQIPREVHLALQRGAEPPRLEPPPPGYEIEPSPGLRIVSLRDLSGCVGWRRSSTCAR